MTSQGAKPRPLVLMVFLLLVALAALGSPDSARAHGGPYWFDLQANDTDPRAASRPFTKAEFVSGGETIAIPSDCSKYWFVLQANDKNPRPEHGWSRTPKVKLIWYRRKDSDPFQSAEFVSRGTILTIYGSGRKLSGVIKEFDLDPPSEFEYKLRVKGKFWVKDTKTGRTRIRTHFVDWNYDAVVPEFSEESFSWDPLTNICEVTGSFRDGVHTAIYPLHGVGSTVMATSVSPPLIVKLNNAPNESWSAAPNQTETIIEYLDPSSEVWEWKQVWRLDWSLGFRDFAGNCNYWSHGEYVTP